jgi:hypothetical protein
MIPQTEYDLQARVFELWDRANRGEITLKELKQFREIAEVFYTLAQAEERVARTELIQVRTHAELTALEAGPTQPLLKSGD